MSPLSPNDTSAGAERPASPDLRGAFGVSAAASLRGLLPPRPAPPEPAAAPEPEPVPVPTPRRPVAHGATPSGTNRRWGTARVIAREHVELLVLAALRAGPADGREVVARLADDSGGRLQAPANTVYRTLHRLTRARLLEHRDQGGRHAYVLTGSGARAARSRVAEWHAFRRAVDAVVGADPTAGS